MFSGCWVEPIKEVVVPNPKPCAPSCVHIKSLIKSFVLFYLMIWMNSVIYPFTTGLIFHELVGNGGWYLVYSFFFLSLSACAKHFPWEMQSLAATASQIDRDQILQVHHLLLHLQSRPLQASHQVGKRGLLYTYTTALGAQFEDIIHSEDKMLRKKEMVRFNVMKPLTLTLS